MKKIYTSFIALATISLAAGAQQLPNVGFEGNWADCTPWTSNGNTKTEGQNPEGWCISNVIGATDVSNSGRKTVGEKVEGRNSSSAVRLFQSFTGLGSIGSNVPAYITLGTTWSTSKTNKSNDGGTFGGIAFTGRPDALSFYYKRSRGTEKPEERSSVIAYSWKGSWSQADVPGNIIGMFGNPTKVTMTDRDRCVLGYDMNGTQGGAVTNNGGVLISKIEQYITENQADWTNAIYEFEYKTNDTPEKINVIISAGDYFAGASAVGKDNEMTVDDVKLVYYSRLEALTVGGTAVEGFAPDTYEYNLDSTFPSESDITCALMGNSGTAKATVALDKENNKAVVTVTNAQGEDIDGNSTHTYTLNFKANEPVVRNGNEFLGTLTVGMGDESFVQDGSSVWIEQKEWPNATLSLYNFTLGDDEYAMQIGDIVVDVTQEAVDGGVKLTGEVKMMQLLDGAIIANVSVDAFEKNGNLTATIPVIWLTEGTEDGEQFPINVTFNGSGKPLTAIAAVNTDNENATTEYYNIQGMRVNADNLPAGIYIRRQGTDTTKVYINK